MMLFKLATYATSECLPAGHGNVYVSLCQARRMKILLNVPSLSCTVHAMQSKPTPSVITFWNNDSFLDYAINNKLTPFISMQNHYNLIYREEEREMFPTLNVRTALSLFLSKQTIETFNTYFSTWALVRFPGPLLLAVFLRVLMEMIRYAHRVIGMDIDLAILNHISLKLSLCLFRVITGKGYSKNAGTEKIINT